ncbi:MAG: GDSL-type esterase/lipase family protein [Anaerolineae bacterium]
MKIVCLGDSLTWVGYGGSYYTELVRLMPEHEWINAGVGGNTVINLLRRLDEDVLSHQPDGVFVMVGGNDAVSYSQPKTRSYYRQAQGIEDGVVTPEQFETAFRDLLTKLQLAHTLVWIGLQTCEYNPETVAALRDLNARSKRIARSFNIPVLDLMETFPPGDVPERPPLGIEYILTIGAREKRGWSDYESARQAGGFSFTFDGMHLTPESAKQVAELVAAFIRSH